MTNSISRIQRAKFHSLLVGTASTFVLGFASAASAAMAADISFNIPSQPLANALMEFSRQSDVNVAASFALVQGKKAPAVQGSMDVNEALGKLLAGSGLKVTKTSDGSFNIEKVAAAASPQGGGGANPRQTAAADTAASRETAIEEVVVTGSRIIREGYEAPTPLTVIGTEQLEKAADTNLITTLATMPAVTGASTLGASSNMLGQGNGGLQTMNLRSLGASRVLVLLDGQRAVASHYSNVVSIDNFPTQLISRVDVVTGGASAVYGSDAVGGVVNFILDKKFTGVKGEISGGLTNYGDGKNYKIDLSAGFGFGPDNRGHVLLSGEHLFSAGITGVGGRKEQYEGWQQMQNPLYNATTNNTVPQFLFGPGGSAATATGGGIVVAGPLKGTAFGPGGTPYKFNYGSVVSGSTMFGGDWASNNIQPAFDLDPHQRNDNLFLRVAYDITDNINVYVQYDYSQNKNWQHYFYPFLLGSATAFVIKLDNAFLPASVRAAMIASGQTQIGLGSWNKDFGIVISDNSRITNRLNAGFEGKFDAFGSTWSWNAGYGYGSTKVALTSTVPSRSRYTAAIDAVVNPANGQIVCRSTLTAPTNGCIPWNMMGVGVNDPNGGAISYLTAGGGFQKGLIELTTINGSITGEPFSIWAGPVSLALSFEHRKDEIHAIADAVSLIGDRIAGNYAPLDGAQSVTEGAVETLIPLAKEESWAKALDLSLAVRFTGYELSGNVTTWKVGATYTPVDDIKLRFTRSRDIRAPNIQDLFAAPSFGTVGSGIIDRGLNNQPSPGNTQQAVKGNPGLVPEKADTTGIGMVLSPSFLTGFTASVDYWDVDISGAINPLTAQQVVDICYGGGGLTANPALCANLSRNPDGTLRVITAFPINLAVQNVRGIDVEASYRTSLDSIGMSGDFSLHGLMTFYLKDYQNSNLTPPVDTVGQHTSLQPPNWKYNLTATYALDPISASLTARGFSSGVTDARFIECTTGCPAATVANPTANRTKLPAGFYLDANVSYKMMLGEATESDIFISVRNMLNRRQPGMSTSFFFSMGTGSGIYESFGAVYRAGIRFKM